MDERLTALRWDTEYRSGRYADDAPLPFVGDILTALDDAPALREGIGLYIGCGNGRNYLPLVDAGLRILGLDLSLEALRQLAARRAALPLICGDFLGFTSAGGSEPATPKLPIGLQLLGRPFGEETILKIAHAYEQSTGWHKERPSLAE